MAAFQFHVHTFQKINGISIYAPCFIALPVDDPADGIHAKSVKMIFAKPVIGAGSKETTHLASGMHEVMTAPLADAYVGMGIFVESCAVIPGKAVVIHGKMHRDKVQDHADVCFVKTLDHLF